MKLLAALKLIWKKMIADNFTDSNGDTDIVRVLAFAAVVEGLVKYGSDTAGAQDLIVLLGGLLTAWAAKYSDPKPGA
jgi:hypothetical protein